LGKEQFIVALGSTSGKYPEQTPAPRLRINQDLCYLVQLMEVARVHTRYHICMGNLAVRKEVDCG